MLSNNTYTIYYQSLLICYAALLIYLSHVLNTKAGIYNHITLIVMSIIYFHNHNLTYKF